MRGVTGLGSRRHLQLSEGTKEGRSGFSHASYAKELSSLHMFCLGRGRGAQMRSGAATVQVSARHGATRSSCQNGEISPHLPAPQDWTKPACKLRVDNQSLLVGPREKTFSGLPHDLAPKLPREVPRRPVASGFARARAQFVPPA